MAFFANTWSFISEWFRERNQRSRLINGFNDAAQNAFISGVSPTLLRAHVSSGERSYRHQFSNFFNSGFRIQAFAGRILSKDEIEQIGNVILSDASLMRKLVVLGFDTLEIHGDCGNYGCRWQIRDHLQLGD